MCRCCQSCWEDFKWNCFEERFCYDESIANYNPEDDNDYLSMQKNGSALSHIQISDNNNLTVPICNQPLRRNNSGFLSNAKIHEEDYRRETQTNVPMLGPEILAVFANSQIFQDHQPTKLTRISTKTFLAGIHSPNKEVPTTPRESEQDRLLRRLEGNNNNIMNNNNSNSHSVNSFYHGNHLNHYENESNDDNNDDDDDDDDDGRNAQPHHPLKKPTRKISIVSGASVVNGSSSGSSSATAVHHKVKFYLD
ncbi:unnamed protein product [Ceratitis capitata]|uniref:(Mediterranean fruit fly) hypothetical protein n=3 Tax=Ceratitis capitata TaxID=7213 RepID=A0A811UP45_CERCA|nr:unnamed protein product [Ceratitis capitata]